VHPSAGRVVRNSAWNLAGLLIPLPIAIAVVPPLIRGLGEARFGLLTLAWAVMGYFALFDLGLGRATTREVAASLAKKQSAGVGELLWSSLWAHTLLGIIGFVLFAALAGPLTAAFDLSAGLEDEFRRAVFYLALSVPVVVVTTAVRGILEGFGRFDVVNAIRLPSSVWTYIAPWAVMWWTPDVSIIVAFVAAGRLASLLAYAFACASIVPAMRDPLLPTLDALRPMIVLGSWLTVGTVILPMMASWDRFVIGARVSAESVGHYAAPYEVVTKLWVFSGALMGAAFPLFTAAWISDRARLGVLLRHATSALVVAAVPGAIVIIASAPYLLPLWLGDRFGRETVPLAQWLAGGVAASVVAQSGLTLLQASGRAEWVARVQTAEMLVYAAVSWWAAGRWGATGVAVSWVARAVIDCAILLTAANVLTRSSGSPAFAREQLWALSVIPVVTMSAVGWASEVQRAPSVQGAIAALAVVVVLVWIWVGFIDLQTKRVWLAELSRRVRS
jgi:O-antigen/teichoic acid export membrane protein